VTRTGQSTALDSSLSERYLEAREVYGGKYESGESIGGTNTGRLEECKSVAANQRRVTFIITGKPCYTTGCVSVVSLSLVPVSSLLDVKPNEVEEPTGVG